MFKLLIFAGTTEGRELTQKLRGSGAKLVVSVATEYGESLLLPGDGLRTLCGRLNMEQMEELMKQEGFQLVVDATHPYAVTVSENIRQAAGNTGTDYLRLVRKSSEIEDDSIVYVNTAEEAAKYFCSRPGKIFLTTGSKELDKFTVIPDYQERITARVLSLASVTAACKSLGFEGRNLICMQGPFSEELNYAMLKQCGASWMVTKDSGRAGGVEEKIQAARRAGVKTVIIGRPKENDGISFEDTLDYLRKRIADEMAEVSGDDTSGQEREGSSAEKPEENSCFQSIYLVGIGTGTLDQLTKEAADAIAGCDAIIGAGRMVEMFKDYHKPLFTTYKPEEMVQFIREHRAYQHIVIAFSGDLGFYSGAKKLLPMLKDYSVKCIPGISSLVYFCSRLGTSWDDARLMSIHGRTQNLCACVKAEEKVFTLLGGRDSVKNMCSHLIDWGFEDVKVSIGENLSYENERILTGTPKELLNEEYASLAVALIENKSAKNHVVTHGIDDEEFLRERVPMTKSEVRAVSVSKLQLCRNSVVYDIGAGTGSVSVEAAIQITEGKVYAVEKKPEAVGLIRDNVQKFALTNVEIIEGSAPEALTGLEIPTHAFIGGSSGNMKEIIGVLLEKNPDIRIVVNAIALETVAETIAAIKEYCIEPADIVQISVAKAKKLGDYQMMMGQNPVYIISFGGNRRREDCQLC